MEGLALDGLAVRQVVLMEGLALDGLAVRQVVLMEGLALDGLAVRQVVLMYVVTGSWVDGGTVDDDEKCWTEGSGRIDGDNNVGVEL